MSERGARRETVCYLVESYAPLIASITVVVFTLKYLLYKEVVFSSGFDNVLNAVITFSSITVGFLGVLLGIMFSLNSSKSISLFMNKEKANHQVKKYFYAAILSGFSVTVLGVLLFVREKLDFAVCSKLPIFSWADFLFTIWLGLSMYMITTTYRIIIAPLRTHHIIVFIL